MVIGPDSDVVLVQVTCNLTGGDAYLVNFDGTGIGLYRRQDGSTERVGKITWQE